MSSHGSWTAWSADFERFWDTCERNDVFLASAMEPSTPLPMSAWRSFGSSSPSPALRARPPAARMRALSLLHPGDCGATKPNYGEDVVVAAFVVDDVGRVVVVLAGVVVVVSLYS